MVAATIITLIAGTGLVLLLVTVVILDRWAQKKAAHDPRDERSCTHRTEDPLEELTE